MNELNALREAAKAGRDPTCPDGTLALLLEKAGETGAKKYLEIGAGEGLTSVALALSCGCGVTAIENDPARAERARENFARFHVAAELFEEDAAEVLPRLTGEYDLIFLDGPKVQYRRYLPDCKRLLRRGGVLVSDDVLLYGWVRGEPPKKRRMIAEHLREYLELLQSDKELETTVYEIGEGVAVSKKR